MRKQNWIKSTEGEGGWVNKLQNGRLYSAMFAEDER